MGGRVVQSRQLSRFLPLSGPQAVRGEDIHVRARSQMFSLKTMAWMLEILVESAAERKQPSFISFRFVKGESDTSTFRKTPPKRRCVRNRSVESGPPGCRLSRSCAS